MEEITNSLETLQNTMPINCTGLNIQKLKIKFAEYQKLIGSLQGNYSAVRKHCERSFDFMKSKIDSIRSTNHFQEAVDHLRLQIGMVIQALQAKPV